MVMMMMANYDSSLLFFLALHFFYSRLMVRLDNESQKCYLEVGPDRTGQDWI